MRYKMPITAEDFTRANTKKKSGEEKNQLNEELKELSKLASNAVTEAVRKEYGAEYMKTDDRSDEDLQQIAQEKATKKIEDENKELTDKTNEDITELNEKAAEKNKNYEEKKAQIENRYDSAKQSASDEALKRGMGRSSMIVNLLKEYDADKTDKLVQKDSEAKSVLEKINGEIADLNAKLEKSLKNTDMRTAFELNERLTELKSERDKANEQALKYNNELKGKLASFRKQLESSDTKKQLISEAENQSKAYYDQMLKKIIAYYSDMPADEIKDDFENGDYASLLSPAAYKKLKTYIESK